MARVIKNGFAYTRLDTNFWSDLKVRRARKANFLAPFVYLRIITLILQDGYYVKVDNDTAFLIAEDLGIDEKQVNECIKVLLNVELIDADMYYGKHILTSHGIQKQYNFLCASAKRKGRIGKDSEFSLLKEDVDKEEYIPNNSEENHISSEEITNNSEEKHIPSEEMPPNRDENAINSEFGTTKKERNKERNYYSFSSFTEEEQKHQIISYFFFDRNFLKPQAEFQKLVAWNYASGNSWEKMSAERKKACAEQWLQLDENKKPIKTERFPENFLLFWKEIMRIGTDNGIPLELFLADEIEYKTILKDGYKLAILDCGLQIREYIINNPDKCIPLIEGTLGIKRNYFNFKKHTEN